MELIDNFINEDITYAKQPSELRNQRTYAVKVRHTSDVDCANYHLTIQSGVNGLLDVARQTYKEANMDVYQLVEQLSGTHLPNLN